MNGMKDMRLRNGNKWKVLCLEIGIEKGNREVKNI